MVACLSFVVLKSPCLFAGNPHADAQVSIVTGANPAKTGMFAAGELSKYLKKLYPSYGFPVVAKSQSGKNIVLSVDPDCKDLPDGQEAYVVASGGKNASIVARDGRGLISGVYGMLDRLGVGFYMSEETMPPPKKEFSFDGWDLSDRPLAKSRYVFNWHNFLSSCSGWDEKDWLGWVDHSRKMGYNAIMVHAYFYNPMHTYSYKGVEKTTGFITTSAISHNWAAIPVNDVRRLPGGEIFDGPVIGCRKFIGHEHEKEYPRIVQSMMRNVFAHAADRGMGINFAFDVDMAIGYSQKLYKNELAEPDLIELGSRRAPNPDTAAGMEYYKAQIKGLVDSYPMLTQITCWFRGTSSLGGTRLELLPDSWREEFNSRIKKYPVLGKYGKEDLLAYFVIAKLTRGYQKALEEMNITGIKIGCGCWRHQWVVPMAIFVPEIELFPLDWNMRNDRPFMKSQSFLNDIKTYASGRVIPYIWAQHDDGRYIGRCFKPTDKLYDKLKSADAAGFGVIHWFKRPCDLFFRNMQRQVWERSLNEPYSRTCERMAMDYWGDKSLGTYLANWLEDAPMFGRATQPNMCYRPWKECRFPDKTRSLVEERIAFLDAVDASRMTKEQTGRLDYFKALEKFVLRFIDAQRHLDRAEKHLTDGDLAKAQDELRRGNPEQAVASFARLSCTGHRDRNEMCYAVSLATKWLGDYDSFRQRARVAPIRIKFGEAEVDPAPVMYGRKDWQWYWLDKKGRFWEKIDLKLLSRQKLEVAERKPSGNESYTEDIFLEGLKLGEMNIPVKPIMRAAGLRNKTHVAKGGYRLKLFASSPSQGTFTVAVNGHRETFSVKGDKVVQCGIELKENADLAVACKLQNGAVVLNGLLLEPVEEARAEAGSEE
jgi:hypothetical protein